MKFEHKVTFSPYIFTHHKDDSYEDSYEIVPIAPISPDDSSHTYLDTTGMSNTQGVMWYWERQKT